MSRRIPIIEDNPANMELMDYLLRAFGYEVSMANDGEAGFDAYVGKPIDPEAFAGQTGRILRGAGIDRRH